jgi:hypothetical protein
LGGLSRGMARVGFNTKGTESTKGERGFGGVVLGVGCWVLGVGCWVLGVGCWVLGVGCWVLGGSCVGRLSVVLVLDPLPSSMSMSMSMRTGTLTGTGRAKTLGRFFPFFCGGDQTCHGGPGSCSHRKTLVA